MKGIISAWVFGVIGSLMVGFGGSSLIVANIGFFLGGFGMNAATCLHYSFLNE